MRNIGYLVFYFILFCWYMGIMIDYFASWTVLWVVTPVKYFEQGIMKLKWNDEILKFYICYLNCQKCNNWQKYNNWLTRRLAGNPICANPLMYNFKIIINININVFLTYIIWFNKIWYWYFYASYYQLIHHIINWSAS